MTDIGFTLNDIETKLNMNEILGKFKKAYDIWNNKKWICFDEIYLIQKI